MNYSRKNILLVVGVLAILFGGLYYTQNIQKSNRTTEMVIDIIDTVRENEDDTTSHELIQSPRGTITIYIAGEVQNPNTYELEHGARIVDAIDAAGGVTEAADITYLNLSAFLNDTDHIIVPKAGEVINNVVINDMSIETTNNQSNNSDTNNRDTRININTATERDLQELPGIGEVLAGRIIAYRDQNGEFRTIHEIKNVPRIGDAIFESIRDLITV